MGRVASAEVVQRNRMVNNADWEIILTDPSLNKFNFGGNIPQNYIMTDIISPMGEKSILYNTVSQEGGTLCIGLDLFNVDQANVASITVKSVNQFFRSWKVKLRDNRNGKIYNVSNEEQIILTETLKVNKVFMVGFKNGETESRKNCVFELELSR
ncbi:MAG TPA: hypothetical protein DEQ34_08970 [Balneolaceae bacterium]|nr:hypothetical protein [Balneolaceae bacterium]|tara:strand:+ start:196129 stop:196593 length:465 start_codon:yes stop_codon:yes gene_type:complete